MLPRAAGGAAVRGPEMGLAHGGLDIEGTAMTFSCKDLRTASPEV